MPQNPTRIANNASTKVPVPNRVKSAKRLKKLAGFFIVGQASFTFVGRSGKATVLNRQWARILTKAADRLAQNHCSVAEANTSAARLLKMARRLLASGLVKFSVNDTDKRHAQWGKILVVAAQRALSAHRSE
jgi:hypothetical protein